MNWKILLLPQKRTRTAFRSNFVNRYMKPPIIAKKTHIRLNGPPFVTAPNKMRRLSRGKRIMKEIPLAP